MAPFAYISNQGGGSLSVIDTTTGTVVTTVPVGKTPSGVAVRSDGFAVDVTNEFDNTVSVIDTATNKVVGSPIQVAGFRVGAAVAPDGWRVYVANEGSFVGTGPTVAVIVNEPGQRMLQRMFRIGGT